MWPCPLSGAGTQRSLVNVFVPPSRTTCPLTASLTTVQTTVAERASAATSRRQLHPRDRRALVGLRVGADGDAVSGRVGGEPADSPLDDAAVEHNRGRRQAAHVAAFSH